MEPLAISSTPPYRGVREGGGTPTSVTSSISPVNPASGLNQNTPYLPSVFSGTVDTWNGIGYIGGNEHGVPYLAAYATVYLTMDSLKRTKRGGHVSAVVRGHIDIIQPKDSTDTSEWGQTATPNVINTTLRTSYGTSDTNFNAFRTEKPAARYVFKETLKVLDVRPSVVFWSADEGVWDMEGYQIAVTNKGERYTQLYGGF